LLRALLVALDAWATHGTPPPPSQVPTRAAASAVTVDEVRCRFPAIPGVTCPEQPNRLYVQSFGPDFDRGVFSKEPPEEDQEREYTVLLPQVDADGLEVAGIRTPDVEVPLATYTGWNLRPTGSAARDQAGIMGSGLPFARTAAERQAHGDPRAALAERYGSRAQYVRRVVLAAQRLVEQRLLLDEDAERYIEAALHSEYFT
jgi:hypothetical protein